MRKMSSSDKFFFIAALLSVTLLSCSPSFYKKNARLNKLFTHQQYEQADALLDSDKKSPKGKAKWIYYLNRGVIAHMLGKYEESNRHFEVAYLMHEDFMKKSVEEVLAFLLNPNISEYHGEDHEALLIHYFKALNYLFLGDNEAALVECRRLDIKLNLFADRYEGSASTYRRDAFMHTLMGLIYQANGEYNNAFVAYRNAVGVYEADYKDLFAIAVPEQLKRDIIFCAFMCEFQDKVKEYQDRFKLHSYNPSRDLGAHNAIVFWQNGLGPVKDQLEINFIILPGLAGGVLFKNEEMGLCFPFPLPSNGDKSILDMKLIRVVFPKYVERPPCYTQATVLLEGDYEPQKLSLAQDVNAISFQVLKERMLWEFSKTLIRVALKQFVQYKAAEVNQGLGLAVGVFNFLTEDADTRNWQTLPHSIYYTRMHSPTTGMKQITFQAFSPQQRTSSYKATVSCNFERGKTKFIEVNTLY